MTKFQNWLLNHKVTNIMVLLGYWVMVVLPHKRFGTFLNTTVVGGLGINVSDEAGRYKYNIYVLALASILLIAYLYLFFRYTMKNKERTKLWSYLALNLVLAITIVKALFVINIEVIHFPQYALFAILLFPLVGNYQGTLIWSTLAGAIDEAYQYFYLAPKDTSHYDFNDVVTNLVGVVFGLLLLRAFNINERKLFNLKRSSVWYGLVGIAIVVMVLHISGYLSIYPSDDRPYHILREWPSGFWSKIKPNVTYHIIRPIEGLVLVCLLWLGFRNIAPSRIENNGTV